MPLCFFNIFSTDLKKYNYIYFCVLGDLCLCQLLTNYSWHLKSVIPCELLRCNWKCVHDDDCCNQASFFLNRTWHVPKGSTPFALQLVHRSTICPTLPSTGRTSTMEVRRKTQKKQRILCSDMWRECWSINRVLSNRSIFRLIQSHYSFFLSFFQIIEETVNERGATWWGVSPNLNEKLAEGWMGPKVRELQLEYVSHQAWGPLWGRDGICGAVMD